MPSAGFKVISIKQELFDQLHKQFEKETKDLEFKPSFSEWLSKLISTELERRKDSGKR